MQTAEVFIIGYNNPQPYAVARHGGLSAVINEVCDIVGSDLGLHCFTVRASSSAVLSVSMQRGRRGSPP